MDWGLDSLPAIRASWATGSVFTSWELASKGLVYMSTGFWTQLLLLKNCFAVLLASLLSCKNVGACSKSKEQLCSVWFLPRGHWRLRQCRRAILEMKWSSLVKTACLRVKHTETGCYLQPEGRKVCDTLIVKLIAYTGDLLSNGSTSAVLQARLGEDFWFTRNLITKLLAINGQKKMVNETNEKCFMLWDIFLYLCLFIL